ncbi:MAG: chloride channel protein [Ferruginibacter sp.]
MKSMHEIRQQLKDKYDSLINSDNAFTRLRHRLKKRYDAIDNTRFKGNVLNALPFWVGAFITGVTAVMYAQLFAWAEAGTHFIYQQASWLFFIVTPLSFFLALYFVFKFATYSRGSGIPQVMASIELSNPKHNHKVNKLLNLKVLFVKILSSLTMVFGGGVVGREGPIIQISAIIFKKINDFLPDWYPKISKQNMIVTGAAAGLASAFNTPLGGIVFAIEELTKTHFSFFKSALLTGVIIAGLTALTLSGPYLYLGFPPLSNLPAWILLIVIPVAFITGVCGCGMGTIILRIFKKNKSFSKKHHKYVYAAICGLIIAALAIFIDDRTFGSGKEIMITTLFTDAKHLEWYIPILRMVGPIISFSTGAAGGIFAPSLSAGASIGAVVAGWFDLSQSATNLIILCGMTGFLTGITKSPFTCSILVLEMTNSHNIIFHIMLTALLSNIISNLMSKQSFYDNIKDRYIEEIHEEDMEELKVQEVVEAKPLPL